MPSQEPGKSQNSQLSQLRTIHSIEYARNCTIKVTDKNYKKGEKQPENKLQDRKTNQFRPKMEAAFVNFNGISLQ